MIPRCDECSGTGEFDCINCDGSGWDEELDEPCNECGGEGTIPCDTCDGSGIGE